MFEVGDIVEIYKGDTVCQEGSSLDILDGTIAEIVKIHTDRPEKWMGSSITYDLKFVELCLKDGYKLNGNEEILWWTSENLRSVNNKIDIEDNDVLNLFT